MIDSALEYLDMGFSIIPVNRSNKRPYISSWKEFQKRPPTPEEIEKWWKTWPDANVAIVCGKVSNIFIVDADGPKGIAWMNEHLPKTGVYSLTGKGVHAVYRIPPDTTIKNAVRLADEVDIRGEGGYFVAPPSIHESGHQYKWQFLMDGWDDLAEYKPKQNGHKEGNLNLDLSAVSQKLDLDKLEEGVPQGERDNYIFKEACRLRGLGLTETEAWIVIKTFASRCRPPFPEKDAFIKLQQAWKYEPNLPDIEVEPEDASFTMAAVPFEILNPGGILQEIVDYVEINSTVSVPFFSLAAAVTFLGNVAGQKVQTETGLRTNIYSIALGYSGAGKNAPFSTLPQLLARTSASKTIGPTELTSSTAILRWLSCNQVAFMMLDEIGLVLKGLKKPDSAASDIPRLFIKLFSATDRPEIKNYANGDAIMVPWHHLSFYGASTPERFWDSISAGEVADGFLARVLIWESHHDAPFPKAVISFQSSPRLEQQINEITSIQTETFTGNGNLVACPIPKIVPRTDDAQKQYTEWARKHHELKNQNKSEGISSIYGRAAEHAAKLALIHALSKDGAGVKSVGHESITWACKTIDFLITNLVNQIQDNVADTDVTRWKQRIIKGIRAKDNHATLRDLMRSTCRGIVSKDLRQYLDDMKAAGDIGVQEDSAKNGKKVTCYFVAKKK